MSSPSDDETTPPDNPNSDADSDADSYDSDDVTYHYYSSSDNEGDYSEPTNIRRLTSALQSPNLKKILAEEESNIVYHEDNYNFPPDPENWREEDLEELWADAPLGTLEPGWDPVWAGKNEWDAVKKEVEKGREAPIAPFYMPYRKPWPAIPDDNFDVSTPEAVIEEMDRVEEFLNWVSYVFEDGGTYEGTVWDDLAHGKGVLVAEEGLVRYEGEWLQNQMEGHGVVEVEIPDIEPVPGSELEAEMRAEGKIIKRDFMTPEDRKWLEMDIEDSMRLAGDDRVIPFYERDEWIDVFGEKPEKGRYRYAGQWKHSRMHGCGVYEVNEQIIYGRFYFGEHLEDSTGCDSDVSALHAGIAEVAAAKARMFVNKPDGMVREQRGPYGDPQHPYFYEEDDVWMAPGFVNQFYEVPDYWKTYVEEIDQEREMWLNSFYKSPLRIPMPAELEYWWDKEEEPEFVLINKEPEPDPEDPTKLIEMEDPLIVHTPTGRIINYVDDEEHGVRLFWQPPLKEGEEVDPKKARFLPLGFDEFYGRGTPGVKKEGALMRLATKVNNTLNPLFDKLEKWTEEKKKDSEMNLKIIEKELELVEAEICLDEAMEDMEMELKSKQKDDESEGGKGADGLSNEAGQDEVDLEDEDDEGGDEGDDEGVPASFGTVGRTETDDTTEIGGKFGKSPFSSLSISLASCSPSVLVPSKLQETFVSWKASRQIGTVARSSLLGRERCVVSVDHERGLDTVNFPYSFTPPAKLKMVRKQQHLYTRNTTRSQLTSLGQLLSCRGACKSSRISLANERVDDYSGILSLHSPITDVFLK